MIYFVRAIDADGNHFGPVKIGWTSKSVAKRKRALELQSPFKLDLLASSLGGQMEEYLLHKHFKHLRLHGEWFEATDELLNFTKTYEDHMKK